MNRKFLLIFFSVFGFLLILIALLDILAQKPDRILNDELVLAQLLVVLLFIIIVETVIILLHRRSINNLLFEKCDPEAYIEKTRKQLNGAYITNNITAFRLNLNVGLSAAGRYEEALLAMPDPTLIKKASPINQMAYHHNNFATFLHLDNSSQAELALTWLRDSLNTLKNAKLKGLVSQHYQRDFIIFSMSKGNFDGAETAFQDQFVRAKNNYERVSAMFNQGGVYAHFGRTDEARLAFEYVIAHGNKLYAVAEAREALAALDASAPSC